MIVDYARIWFPVSFVVHAVMLTVLLSLPAPVPPADSATTLIRIDTLEPAPPEVEKPAPNAPERPSAPARRVTTPSVPMRQPARVAQQSANAGLAHTVPRVGTARLSVPLRPHDLTPRANAGAPGSPRDPLSPPGGGTGYENGIANLPGVPVDTPQRQPGGWADRPGAGGNPGFGLTGPGKLSPLPPGGGSGSLKAGPMGNAGALRPGVPTGAYAGRGGGFGGDGSGGTYSPQGGGGKAALGDGVGDLPGGSGPSVMHGRNGTWADRPGGGGIGGNGGYGSGAGLAAAGPGRGPGSGRGGGGTSLTGPVGHGTGVTPGAGIGRGPGKAGFGGGGGGGFSGGTPSAGGDILGNDVKHVPIASAGGPKGSGGAWADRPGGGGGSGGNGGNLAPSGPSYGASAVGGPTPNYPLLAQKEGQQGNVIVEVTIDSSGQVKGKPKIKKRSNSDALDNEAVRAVMTWQYRAAMRNGERITSTLRISITFTLGEKPEVKQL